MEPIDNNELENSLHLGIDITSIHEVFEDKGSDAYDLTSEDLSKVLDIKDDPNYEKYKKEIRDEGTDFDEDSQSFKSIFLLHKYFAETPREEIDRAWKEVEDMGIKGPTVEEYFQSQNPVYQYAKGYSEGAAKFKEETEKAIEVLAKAAGETHKKMYQDLNDAINLIYNTK